MNLKRIVAVCIIVFSVVILYFWVAGIWIPTTPPDAAQQQANERQAAKDGLYNKPSPPIIH
jgi:hypothetical protein